MRRAIGIVPLVVLLALSACSGTDPAAPITRSLNASPPPSPAGSVDPGVKDDEFTQFLVRFMDARVAGTGAEAFVCCEAMTYSLIYGSEELGRPDRYGVASRVDESGGAVTFTVYYEGSYQSEPEDIVVRREASGNLAIAAIYFLGD